jgi:hypothetical protein
MSSFCHRITEGLFERHPWPSKRRSRLTLRVQEGFDEVSLNRVGEGWIGCGLPGPDLLVVDFEYNIEGTYQLKSIPRIRWRFGRGRVHQSEIDGTGLVDVSLLQWPQSF